MRIGVRGRGGIGSRINLGGLGERHAWGESGTKACVGREREEGMGKGNGILGVQGGKELG